MVGASLVNTGGEDGCWVNDCLEQAIFSCERPGLVGQQQFVLEKLSGEKQWISECVGKVEARVWQHRVAGFEWKGEAYVHQVPVDTKKCASRVFFCLNWVAGSIFNETDTRGNFIGKHCADWKHALVSMDVDASHIRESAKALAAQARAGRKAVPASVQLSSEMEFSVSCTGLLALLTYFAASARMKHLKAVNGILATLSLARLLLDKFLAGHSFAFESNGGGCTVVLCNNVVDLDALAESQLSDRSSSRIGKDLAPEIHTADFLVHLLENSRSCRRTAQSRAKHSACLMDCLLNLAFLFEQNFITNLTPENHDHIFLGLLPGRARPRRVPGGFRRAVADAVVESSNMRRASQARRGRGRHPVRHGRGHGPDRWRRGSSPARDHLGGRGRRPVRQRRGSGPDRSPLLLALDTLLDALVAHAVLLHALVDLLFPAGRGRRPDRRGRRS